MPIAVFDLRHAWDVTLACATAALPAEGDLVGVDQVAALTGMSTKWVYETFSVPAKGGIKPMKFGHLSKWYRWEVQAWIAAKHRAASR